jgi:hypothetical protein
VLMCSIYPFPTKLSRFVTIRLVSAYEFAACSVFSKTNKARDDDENENLSQLITQWLKRASPNGSCNECHSDHYFQISDVSLARTFLKVLHRLRNKRNADT